MHKRISENVLLLAFIVVVGLTAGWMPALVVMAYPTAVGFSLFPIIYFSKNQPKRRRALLIAVPLLISAGFVLLTSGWTRIGIAVTAMLLLATTVWELSSPKNDSVRQS